MPRTQGALVSAVLPDGIGAEVGMEPGDLLLSINGHPLRDLVDYQFYGADEDLELVVERAGEQHHIAIERDYDEDLGLEFAEALFDSLRECSNHCPFCFVRQMPPASTGGEMRRSLCLRDDDYRLSFLSGNFITLTNLTEDDWQRIAEQRLSPLYVSVHATDTALRRRLLGNPAAPDVMAQLRRLAGYGIEVNAQVVVVPEWNDGEALRRTIADLAGLWPSVRTLAIVPLGLTRYHRGGLRLLRPDEARAVLALVAENAPALRARFGCTWLYPSDEMFLLADEPVPPAAFYDDDAQRENGVGLVRELLDDWAAARAALARAATRKRRAPALHGATLVCGTLIAPTLRALAAELRDLVGVEVEVLPVVNRLFGEQVTVSGLLTGADVLEALAARGHSRERAPGERIFLPDVMFAPGEVDAQRVTLDGLTLEGLAAQLGTPVSLANTLGEVAEWVVGKGGKRR